MIASSGIAVLRSNRPLDSSFGGGDGRVETSIGSKDDVVRALALQSNGKIVAAGLYSGPSHEAFGVIRYDTANPVTIAAKVSGGVPTSVKFAVYDGTTLTMHDGKTRANGGANSTSPPGGMAASPDSSRSSAAWL